LPRPDQALITTVQFSRFHKIEFDEMPYKLDSTEYARSFSPNPILPCVGVSPPKKKKEKKGFKGNGAGGERRG